MHSALEASPAAGDRSDPHFELIELFFFAYRDFVGGADQLLERYRFGRAHHRVLHFVTRRPGMTIAELLDILKITKQSLARVLRDWVEPAVLALERGDLSRLVVVGDGHGHAWQWHAAAPSFLGRLKARWRRVGTGR